MKPLQLQGLFSGELHGKMFMQGIMPMQQTKKKIPYKFTLLQIQSGWAYLFLIGYAIIFEFADHVIVLFIIFCDFFPVIFQQLSGGA